MVSEVQHIDSQKNIIPLPEEKDTIAEAIDLRDPQYYINREISLLRFHRRVLEEAMDETVPLLERVKFLAIVSNNMDEFFMTRVAALSEQQQVGVVDTPADGMTPQ